MSVRTERCGAIGGLDGDTGEAKDEDEDEGETVGKYRMGRMVTRGKRRMRMRTKR